MRLDLDAFRAGGRRCGGSRRAIILSALFITLLFFLLLSSSSSPVTASVIVSIATSSARLDRELPVTLRSLLSQTVEPTEIRVHFALDDRAEVEAKLDEGRLGRLFFHPLVKRYYVEDIGPGSKYTYVLMDLIRRAATGEPWLANMPVVIADDDHSYSPYMLSTLLDAHAAMPDASVGLRGWRVRCAAKFLLHRLVNSDRKRTETTYNGASRSIATSITYNTVISSPLPIASRSSPQTKATSSRPVCSHDPQPIDSFTIVRPSLPLLLISSMI